MAKAKRAAASAGAAGADSSKAKKHAEGVGPRDSNEEECERGGDRRLLGPPPPPPPRPEDRQEEEEEGNTKNDGEEKDAGMWIKIPKRRNLFSNPDTWWMVDLHADPIPQQGATPLVLRCMRELGWSEAAARANVRAYRQFLRIKAAAKDWDATLLSPSLAVDQVWHQHVLDTANYARDCLLLCDGHFVHHDPDGGLDVRARKNRLEATRQALLDTYGDEEGGGGALDRSSTGPWKEVFGGANGEGPAAAAAAAAPPGGGGAAAEGGGAPITIEVVQLTGMTTRIRVRNPAERMGRVFADYGRTQGVEDAMEEFRFIFGGRQLGADETPLSLGLRDGDRIHVMSRRRGC